MDGKQRLVLDLPPGFHFAPTDAELIVDYLRRKMDGLPPHLPIFNDVPIIDYRPDQITEDFRGSGEDRWYFFTKRTRKYATGTRPDRTTPGRGYWKATGPQKDIFAGGGEQVGRRRTLVFYTGPDDKTDWTMNEYENITSKEEANDKNVDKLGEWVLCTIQRQKTPRAGDEEKEGKAKASDRKRKGKAQKGTDDQVLQIQGPDEAVPEMAWPEEGDEMDMFELEQGSRPNKRPQMMQQQHDEPPPPCPETMMPVQDCDYGPGIAPPSREPLPQLSDSEMVPSHPAVSCYSFDESMLLLLQFEMTGPVMGVGYDHYGMTMYQPDTSHLGIAAGPLGAFSCGSSGAAHQPAGHLNNDGYASDHHGNLLGAGNHHGNLLGACNSAYTYPQQPSYAAGINKLATSSNSTYSYMQQHSHAAGTNKLAPSSSTYTYQQQHAAHTAGTNKADRTCNLAPSSSTYTYQQQQSCATSNSTYTYQQQQSCAAGVNKLALVRGPMSSGIGQGSDVQPQVELRPAAGA